MKFPQAIIQWKVFRQKVPDIAPKKWSWSPPLFKFFWKKVHHSMRNEKLGKVGKFRDPNASIEWAVHEKP